MSRPKVTDRELKDQRVVIMVSPSELTAIDDWMFSHRIRSRGEAIRQLITKGVRSSRDIGSAVLENEIDDEFSRRCALDLAECPQAIWEDVCAERGVSQ